MTTWQWATFEQLSTTQLYQILALREEVFVVEQRCPYQDADGQDFAALHLMAWQEQQLLAYARIFAPEQGHARIGRVVTKASGRGQGLGQQLMQRAIAYCQQHWPEASIIISAQRYLEQFYQQLGFEICSEPYLEDDIPHIAMQIKAIG
ncbi:GNAT family N-acetyltransferase [Agarivorans sp.]|uniref:GNAT family N-acetyltransferase n=1 Tax=Agarivorans sp. TaxID=1872412 RepID=UPI003D054CCD